MPAVRLSWLLAGVDERLKAEGLHGGSALGGVESSALTVRARTRFPASPRRRSPRSSGARACSGMWVFRAEMRVVNRLQALEWSGARRIPEGAWGFGLIRPGLIQI